MKKGSGKIILIAALLSAVVCSAVRFFQIVSLTEYDTGFFYTGSEVGGLLIYILLAVCAVLLILLAFAGKKNGDDAFTLSSAGMGDNATRWLGISEIIGALLMALKLMGENETAVTVTIVVSSAALIVSGAGLLGRVVPPKFTGHLKLIVAVCMFFRLANFFNGDLLVRNHAENLIILLTFILASAFYASLGRFYARIETKNTRIGEISLGLLTFLGSATHVFSDLLAMAFGGAEAAAFVKIDTDVAAAAVISAVYLAVIFFTEKKKDLVPIAEPD